MAFGKDSYLPFMSLRRPLFNVEVIGDVTRPLSQEEKEFIFRAHRENLRADWESGRRDGYRLPRIEKTYDMKEDALYGFTPASTTISLINVPRRLRIEMINKYKVMYRGTPTALLLLLSLLEHENRHIRHIFSPLLMKFWWEEFIQKTLSGMEPEPPRQEIPITSEILPIFHQGLLLFDREYADSYLKTTESVVEATSPQLYDIFLMGISGSEPHKEALISDIKFNELAKENWDITFTDLLFLFRGWGIGDIERFIYEVRRDEERYDQLKKSRKDGDLDLFLIDVAGINVDGEFEKRINYLRRLENKFDYQPSKQRIQTIRKFMEEAAKEKTDKVGKIIELLAKTSLHFIFHEGKLYIDGLAQRGFRWGWDQSIQLFVDMELALRLHRYPPSRMLNMLKRMECPLCRSPQWRDTCGVGEEDPHITKWIQHLTDRT